MDNLKKDITVDLIHSKKDNLRTYYKQLRNEISASEWSGRATSVINQALTILIQSLSFQYNNNPVIALYSSINSEINLNSLMAFLYENNYQVVLPVVSDKNLVLDFKLWNPAIELNKGYFDINEPSLDAESITPDIIITPFLTADHEGNRLGYGKGYYDRTITRLKSFANKSYIGIGYHKLIHNDTLPKSDIDLPLDIIVTEEGTFFINPNYEKSYFSELQEGY